MSKMDKECGIITKTILPAIRASIAEAMVKEYGYTQEKIAKELGVVQVAVSKYLNKKYSKEVKKVNRYFNANGLGKIIAKEIFDGKNRSYVRARMDEVCAEAMLKIGVLNGRRT